MIFDQLADDLKLIVWTNIKVSLHTFHNRLSEVLRVDLEHDLEWEPFQDRQLTAEIIRVFVDGQPDLHSVVSVLPVDLIQVEAIVHGLLNAHDVIIITDIEPVIKHRLNPTLAVQEVKSDLTAKELGHEQVSLSLKVLDDTSVHLG